MERYASAIWLGSMKDGSGRLTTDSQALVNIPYTYRTRFENQKGTNPEELIGAAHAGCFSMALSGELQKMQLTPESIETQAAVTLEQEPDRWSVTAVHLKVSARIPNASQDQFQSAAEAAKANCPISRLLKAKITIEAQLQTATFKPQDALF